ncbi:MAG: TIR domain-containing protein [Magnetococcales bacterium]|nr:TIR domain-containing protein [Magnetococcales bacterium]
MATPEFKYKAFICYSRKNKRQAKWLRHQLVRARTPKDDQELIKIYGNSISDEKIFIDEANISAGSGLPHEIEKSLSASEFLIVICTPEAVRSDWMDKEIRYFKRHRNPDHIIPCVFRGTPLFVKTASLGTIPDAEQCLPRALRYRINARGETINELEEEPSWADFRRFHSDEGRGAAGARVLSRLLGVVPDRLVLFHKRRDRQIMWAWIVSVSTVALVLAGLSVFALYQRGRAESNFQLSQKNLASSLVQSARLEASQGRIRTGARMAFDARNIHNDRMARVGLWDLLGRLPRETVYNLKQPIPGKGVHPLAQGQLAVVAETRVVVYESKGGVREAEHGAGMSLSSAISTDGSSVIILGREQGRLVRFDLEKMQATLLKEHGRSCSWMAKANHRDRVVLGCNDGWIRVYDIDADGTVRPVWQADKSPSGKKTEPVVAISNDGGTIFWAYGPGNITGWNVQGDRALWERSVQDSPAKLIVSHGGEWLAWYTLDGHVGMVGTGDGNYLWDKKLEGGLFDLAFSPDDERLAVAVQWPAVSNRKPGLLEWELASGRETLSYEAPDRFDAVAYSVAGNPLGLVVRGAVYEILPVAGRHWIPLSLPVRNLWKGRQEKDWFALTCGVTRNRTERVAINRSRVMQTFAMLDSSLSYDHECLAQGMGTVHWLADDRTLPVALPGSERATVALLLPEGQFLVGTREGVVNQVVPNHPEQNRPLLPHPLGEPIQYLGFIPPDFVVLSQRFGLNGSGIYRLGPEGLIPHFLLMENYDNGRWLVTGEINHLFPLPVPGRVLFAVNARFQGNVEGKVIQFDVNERKIVAEVPMPGGVVRDIIALPGGDLLALALANGQIALLNSKTWRIEQNIDNGKTSVTSLLTWEEPDAGRLLLAGDAGGSLTFHFLDDPGQRYQTLPLNTPVLSLAVDKNRDGLVLGTPQGVLFMDHLKRTNLPGETDVQPDLGIFSVDEMVHQAMIMKDAGKVEQERMLMKEVVRLRPWDTTSIDRYTGALNTVGLMDDARKMVDEKFALETKTLSQEKDPKLNALKKMSRINQLTSTANIDHDQWVRGGDGQHLIGYLRVLLEGLREMPESTMLHMMFQIGFYEAGQFETLLEWMPLSRTIQNTLEPSAINPKWLEKFGIYSAFMLGTPELISSEQIDRAYDPNAPHFGPGHRVIRNMLLDPSRIETDFSAVERQIPNDAKRDMAIIHLLVGLAHQRQGRAGEARHHFQLGQDLGDYFTLNRQALQRMEGRWHPVAIPDALVEGYRMLLEGRQGIGKND